MSKNPLSLRDLPQWGRESRKYYWISIPPGGNLKGLFYQVEFQG